MPENTPDSFEEIDTLCVHAGSEPDSSTGGMSSAIDTSTAHMVPKEGHSLYPRYNNTPNQMAAAKKIASLEQAENGHVFASGMSAISTSFMALLNKGDHAIVQSQIYGGAHKFVSAEFEKSGIEYTWAEDMSDFESLEKLIKSNTKLIYFETPSNPLLKLVDISKLADFAKTNKLISVLDNTFATPIVQRAIPMGVDLVIHSGTKYLGGHSDLICGAVVSDNEDILAKIFDSSANFGGTLGSRDAYLLERSLKTLSLRVRKQNENALLLAKFLESCDLVSTVYYPGLPDHPGYEIASKQMDSYGAMISFEMKEEYSVIKDKLDCLTLIKEAISLGGLETTISLPCDTSHYKVPKEERLKLGISDSLLRLSVGIENPEDLSKDLDALVSKKSIKKLFT